MTHALYADQPLDVHQPSYDYYMANFEEIFKAFQEDLKRLHVSKNPDELKTLFFTKYFNYDVTIDGVLHENYLSQPLAYHFGADLWGMIHDVFGKEKVFELILNPDQILPAFNEAFVSIGKAEYQLPLQA